jgi:putative oxygen-independent coproporphyrinogen III oxidase
MPSRAPEGELAPADGALPQSSYDVVGERAFGFYVHVPFCLTRCGYCDFNTYTASELGTGASAVGPASFPRLAVQEVRRARQALGPRDLPAGTVFFGGGTPTLLPPDGLGAVLAAIRDEFGLAPDAEVTTEANPDSVSLPSLQALRASGFTRISFGMQSAVPHVLATLDRTHDPDRVPAAVAWAREAGFAGVSLDLIYGTPGETLADWRRSLEAAVAMQPDHISAYALVVEEGTRLGADVRRGTVPPPDDDDLADKYLLAEELLTGSGFGWYEVSNWALTPGQRCRHNVGYWQGADWWGVGPGAHSHVGGTRWWNVRHPSAYAARLADGRSPAQGREVLTDEQRRVERIMLGVRLVEGHPLTDLTPGGRRRAETAVDDGLLERTAHADGRAALTTRGRLLADAVVRALT